MTRSLNVEVINMREAAFDHDPVARSHLYSAVRGVPDAVIIDGWNADDNAPFFSEATITVARTIETEHVPVFIIASEAHHGRTDKRCSLWQARVKNPHADKPTFGLSRIGDTIEAAYFHMKSGDVYVPHAGDSNMDDLTDTLNDFSLFKERNWPAILAKVRELICTNVPVAV